MTGRPIDARLAELRPHPQNYNRHSPAQVKRLQQSLKTFGQPKPIVIWRGLIIAGHGLAEAARGLGWERLQASDMSEEWTEAQATAFLGADNELARLADPDEAALAALAASLADVDRELAALAAGSEERLRELQEQLELYIIGVDADDMGTRRETNNMGIIGKGENIGLQFGHIMVVLDRELYDRMWLIVDDPKWPDRKSAVMQILEAGLANIELD